MRHHSQQSGFSLIEMLVYLSILVMVSAVAVSSLLSYSDILAKQKVNRLLTEEASVVLESLIYSIRNADAVNTGGSTLEDPDGVLALDNSGGTDTFEKDVDTVTFTESGEPTILLLSPSVTVSDLTFYHFTTGNTELVRFSLTIQATANGQTATETFYGGSVLRNSYD